MIIDNKKDRYDDGLDIKTVWHFINQFSGKEKCDEKGNLDIVTGYFTIHTLSKLYEAIPEEDNFRIISSEMVGDDYKKDLIADLLSDDMDIMNIGNIDKCAKQAIAFLERDNVQMRAQIPDFCHAKAYIFTNNRPAGQSYYISGSSNLTPAGIGLKPVNNVELNIAETCQKNNNNYSELKKWYEEIWDAARTEIPEDREDKKSKMIPVKDYFIRKIKEYFKTYSPKEIYYKILFELFNSEIDLDGGIEHQKDMSLLQTSVIWKTLFNYQQKGVISLIKMLRKYNGAILADAVGLGKTFSALAVIKYFQTQNYTTVVLCPKKLEENWKQYQKGGGSQFEKDEFDYEVRFHTDLQKNRLQDAYKTYKLSYLQSRKKLLIVIDESHNLRNEKSNRYKDLLENLIKNQPNIEGRDVKVLMLSATPINTGLADVKGQFKLIAHGDNKAFDNEEMQVESLDDLFQSAQSKYTNWCKDDDRTIGAFINQLPKAFKNMTDKLIVVRTRSSIEKTLGGSLGFPKRRKPRNVYQGVDHFGDFKSTDEIYDAFENLFLTAYQPSIFLHESRQEARNEAKRDWDDDINRERFLVKMMCVLFMKRLESSWHSCMMTVKKVLAVHEDALKKVEDYKKGTDSVLRQGQVIDEDEFDDDYQGRREIKISDIKNLGGFEAGLRHDINQLKSIHNGLKDFKEKYETKTEPDLKLNELVKILNEKKESENKKLVIFTAYADTAEFLFNELKKLGFSKMAYASGNGVDSTGHHSKHGFSEILQSFAPYTKLYKEKEWSNLYEDAKLDQEKYYDAENDKWNVSYEMWKDLVTKYRKKDAELLNDEIDILIATDCLSEGQNLQDADMQVNYDIHWNPVRLIQRFGRIDRIGSRNKYVSCVNFWPVKTFEAYLKLETRIQNRMAVMNVTGAETQELNEKYAEMVKDNPVQDRNADRLLQELKNNSISDIESPQTLSLKDFSYEPYRQELVELLNQQKDFYLKMPNGIFSGFVNKSEKFADIPESLVALVGYPKKQEGKKQHQYKELYLMCQPVDKPEGATFREINKAEILDFLCQNKEEHRFVPEWITDNDQERIVKLSGVLKEWMRNMITTESQSLQRDMRKVITMRREGIAVPTPDEKFTLENFDLIVWEYVSNKN